MVLRALAGEAVRSFFGGRPLAGVDGSVVSLGASYPYCLSFFRALAKVSRPAGEEGKTWSFSLFCPLLPAHGALVEEMIAAGRDAEEALTCLRWEFLVRRELEAARACLERHEPRLLLWDGGFARLRAYGGEEWEEFKKEALARETVLLGVTEEVAARSLGKRLGFSGEAASPADRELLYGLLEPGEAFFVAPGRLYARLAHHPQAVAVDYLPEQEEFVLPALRYVYTITPRAGRGFPLWLDIVDAEVRLTRQEAELLLSSCLDPALTELFLRPLRARRDY